LLTHKQTNKQSLAKT